jgi:hypothetical protein
MESLRGAFAPKHTVLLDNKLYRGKPGYHVVQPLRLADGKHVLDQSRLGTGGRHARATAGGAHARRRSFAGGTCAWTICLAPTSLPERSVRG